MRVLNQSLYVEGQQRRNLTCIVRIVFGVSSIIIQQFTARIIINSQDARCFDVVDLNVEAVSIGVGQGASSVARPTDVAGVVDARDVTIVGQIIGEECDSISCRNRGVQSHTKSSLLSELHCNSLRLKC